MINVAVILIVIFLIIVCFHQFSFIMIPILFLFLLAFILKVYKQCKRYGIKKVFRMSYSKKKVDMLDYIDMMLNEIPRVHAIKRWNSFLIYIDYSNIYIFCSFYNKGTVLGNEMDDMLTCGSGRNKLYVKNPLIDFNNQIDYLENYFGENIQAYLVVPNRCQFLIKNNKIKILFLKDLYYEMIRHREKRYAKEQFLTLKEKLDLII